MHLAAHTPSEAMPPSPSHRPSDPPRPSSAINVAMDDVPESFPPAAEGSDDDDDDDEEESVRGLSTKSGTAARESRESQDPGSGPGSVRSSNDTSAVKVEEGSTEPADTTASGLSVPVQKRRRVTRACDECRRKKIKCDGRSPCTHCSVYSYECTYDKPSNRRRNPAPAYIEALENRLQQAEALLRKYAPEIDLSDTTLDPAVQQEFANRERVRAQAAKLGKSDAGRQPGLSTLPKRSHQQDRDRQPGKSSQDAQLLSMVETIEHLELVDGNEWDFHGVSSGAMFLRRLKEQMGVYGHDKRAPFLPRPPRPPGMFNLDSPRSSVGSPWEPSDVPAMYVLPPKELTRNLCYYSLSCATCLLRIVHVPSFYDMVDALYDKGPEDLGPDDHRSLGLLYSVMALGSMYTSGDDDAATQVHYKAALDNGFKYYASARLLLQDITDCRDLTSLQALLFLILFLQATSNLSGCYAFLGIALRSALRMGLHRHLSHVELTPIEDESRRRVFYVIRQMDTYVSALLGFPLLLHDDDIDQLMPTEVDDEHITKEAITPPPPGTPSFFQAMNAHARLMQILSRVIKTIYPAKGMEEYVVKGNRSHATYVINYTSIKEIERDLQEWLEQLPNAWRPSPEGPIEVVRVRSLLRFTYAHVQMMLYRPFLHYVSPRLSSGKNVDERYYACAAACISVSRNIIHIGMEIRKHAALLVGPYWFILYTEFFAILSLAFYALENPDKAGTSEILADAHAGREFIASLSKRSLAADRVTDGLNVLFEQLPDWITKSKGETQPRPVATKKRSASGPVPAEAQPTPRTGEDAARAQSRYVGSEQQRPRPISQRMAVEAAAQRRASGPPGQSPMAMFGDPMPRDMLAGSGSPASDAGPFQRPAPGDFSQIQPQLQGVSSGQMYNKLGAVMFPSGDPFEYPSQPFFDSQDGSGGIARQQQQQQQHHHHQQQRHHQAQQQQQQQQRVAAQQHADSVPQFYGMPPVSASHHVYDNIEGQLLGPIPPYLMQPGAGLSELDDLAAQIYDASSMMALQQRHAGGGGMASHPHHSHHQGPSGSQMPQVSAPGGGAGHQADIDDILLAESGFGTFPPHPHYRRI